MKLSKIDLSQHLGVTPKTIDRWMKQGKLPISKKDGNYLVRGGELEKWAFKHQIKLSLPHTQKPKTEPDTMISLSDAVGRGGIHYDIQGHDPATVLKSSIDRMTRIPGDFKLDLLDRLIERENALSTGIGNGVAVPHPREPLAYLNYPMVSICLLDKPVDYNALDHQPVFALCFILCPSLKNHLHLLSALAFCLKSPAFVDLLKARPNLDQLIQEIETLQTENRI